MVFSLDAYFVHRMRALKLKDGNQLNEVRSICNSLMNDDNKCGADKTIKWNPAKAVLKHRAGDQIPKGPQTLSAPLFAEMKKLASRTSPLLQFVRASIGTYCAMHLALARRNISV
jgi:hypothetical protein